VHTHFELFAALLVYMRALYDRKGAFAGWQRDWSREAGARTQGSVHYLLCCLVNYFVVVCLQADTYALLADFGWSSWFLGFCHR
jgi:hypothetical protein